MTPEMERALLEDLPDVQRIAASYLPSDLKDLGISLLALDQRLSRIIRVGEEPALKQIKLAWWRERLAEQLSARPKGDAVLDALAAWNGHEASLIAVVDAWEELLADELNQAIVAKFAGGRARPFGTLAELADHSDADGAAREHGRLWALADLAVHLPDGPERALAIEMGQHAGTRHVPLPFGLRAVRILSELGRRSLQHEAQPPLSRRTDALVALRIGLLGR